MDDFQPQTAFEGWVKKAIEELEKRFDNHLAHHEQLENRIITWGIAFTAVAMFIGWVLRDFIK